MPITNPKKSLIHVAKAKLGMEEADYRALLMRAAGVSSSSQLDVAGFNMVMAEFERLGFRGTRARAWPPPPSWARSGPCGGPTRAGMMTWPWAAGWKPISTSPTRAF